MTFSVEQGIIRIALPYPHKNLNPNARKHWRIVASHKAKLRFDCKVLAKQSPVPTLNYQGKLDCSVVFHPPSNRKRDIDNVIAAFKAGFDGIADAWGIDDSCFNISPVWGNTYPPYGGVVVEVGK